MNLRRSICIAFPLGLWLSFTSGAPSGRDDISVLVAYLHEIARRSKSSKTFIVETEPLDILQSGDNLLSIETIRRVLPEARPSVAEDLLLQATHKRSVALPLGALGPSLRVLQPSAQEVKRVLDSGGYPSGNWKRLKGKFQGASSIVGFSCVGYSEDFDQAIFVVRFICEGLCGGADIVLMQRSEKGWRLKKEGQLWVS